MPSQEERMPRAFLALFALFIATASAADTVDFTALASGDLGTSVAVSGVTFESTTNLSNQSDQYFQAAGGAICASKGTGDNCRGNMTVNFNGKVKKLALSSAGHQSGDVGSILVYR